MSDRDKLLLDLFYCTPQLWSYRPFRPFGEGTRMSTRILSYRLRNGIYPLAKQADDIVGRDLGEDVGILKEGIGH